MLRYLGMKFHNVYQFSSVQLLSHVQLFATPGTAAHQASLSITNSGSLPKLMSIESVIPSSHLILCLPFLLLPSIFPNIRVFSNESALRIGDLGSIPGLGRSPGEGKGCPVQYSAPIPPS